MGVFACQLAFVAVSFNGLALPPNLSVLHDSRQGLLRCFPRLPSSVELALVFLNWSLLVGVIARAFLSVSL